VNLAEGPAWVNIVQAVSSAVSGLASIALVVVALLFREEVRAARRRPRLYISFEGNSPDTMAVDNVHPAFWIRFRVGNERGRDAALRVQLLLLGVHQVAEITDRHLHVPSRPFQTADLYDTQVDIPSCTERRFDIAYVELPHSDVPGVEPAGVNLALQPRSSTGRDVLGVGKFRLTMVLAADNADATYWTADITLTKIPEKSDDLSTSLIVSGPVPLPHRPVI
jgi:hypothetical protein